MSFNAYPDPHARPVPRNFKVTIAVSIANGTNQGFIDHQSVALYGAKVSPVFPATLNNSLAKERSNMRYLAVIQNISENISPVITGIVSNATVDAVGTSFSFVASYDRSDYLYTRNELSNQVLITDPIAAIKRQVARAFVRDLTSVQTIYVPGTADPLLYATERMESVTAAAFDTPANLATIEAGITVAEVILT